MEMHQLQYFVKVAELGNFTRAAEACLVAQPSLSQAILKLERELGQPLFERLGRKVRLTDAGRMLLDRAQQILALVEDARARVRDTEESGRVAVAAIPTVAPYFLPRLLKSFAERYPGAALEVHEDVTETAVKRLLTGEIDLAIMALPLDEPLLEVTPLYEEPLWLALPPKHPLASKKRVTIRDIRDEPFVLLNEAHCLSDQVVSFCRRRSFQPLATGRTNQLAMVQELVALGQGISLMPDMAVQLDRSRRCVYRPLAGDKPTRTIAMAWHKQRYQTGIQQRFREAVQEYARSLAQQHRSKAGGD